MNFISAWNMHTLWDIYTENNPLSFILGPNKNVFYLFISYHNVHVSNEYRIGKLAETDKSVLYELIVT